jgi:ABC-2 type transport system permease protein
MSDQARATSAALYTRYEMLRAVRSTRFLLFSLAFPLVMFFLFAGPNRNEQLDGIPFPLYFMTGMVAWGAMIAVMASGARIAGERAVGWNRQLRLTPLSVRAYFRAKVITGYLMAGFTIVLLYLAGTALGVRLGVDQWLGMTGLILVGLVPFTVIGILLGHLLTVDSLGPAMGGITGLFAVFGGAWGPIATDGFMLAFAKALPSYWLVQAGKTALGGGAWPPQAWLVVGLWTAVLVPLAATVYRRDTART